MDVSKSMRQPPHPDDLSNEVKTIPAATLEHVNNAVLGFSDFYTDYILGTDGALDAAPPELIAAADVLGLSKCERHMTRVS
jgi:hypothetical protein